VDNSWRVSLCVGGKYPEYSGWRTLKLPLPRWPSGPPFAVLRHSPLRLAIIAHAAGDCGSETTIVGGAWHGDEITHSAFSKTDLRSVNAGERVAFK
jgi:hypothetical protein